MVPVPPKAEIYPEKVSSNLPPAGDPDYALGEFYDVLRKNGVDVLDVSPKFHAEKNRRARPGVLQDGHPLVRGGLRAGGGGDRQGGARKTRRERPRPAKTYASVWKDVAIDGDLGGMLGADAKKPGPETISVRAVERHARARPETAPCCCWATATRWFFHDFLAERAGLLDQLAAELGSVPDRIAIRGSGATPVRIDLYRRGIKEPGYLAKKKVVVWVFTAAGVYPRPRRAGRSCRWRSSSRGSVITACVRAAFERIRASAAQVVLVLASNDPVRAVWRPY